MALPLLWVLWEVKLHYSIHRLLKQVGLPTCLGELEDHSGYPPYAGLRGSGAGSLGGTAGP